MTHFPHKVRQPRLVPLSGIHASVPSAPMRDILWGRPLFKAPSLPNPRVAFEPLPFLAQRFTRSNHS